MESIYNKTMSELEDYFLEKQDKKFRAVQVFEWLYQKKVSTFEEMSNLKKEVIATLEADFSISSISIKKIERDQDVSKYLFSLKDGEKIEAVLMNHHY